MVILTKNFNGLGNQLLLCSHFLVNAYEYGYELAIPSLLPHAAIFESTVGKRMALFGEMTVRLYAEDFATNVLHKALQLRYGEGILTRLPLLHRLLGIRLGTDAPNGEDTDLNSTEYLTAAHKPRPLLIQAWQYRDKRHFAEHGDLVRKFFRPIKPYREAVTRILTTNREHADVVVGVHIRRGDYAGWLGGVYFFTNATYARAMREMLVLFPASTRVRFILFSNEPIPTADFAEFDTGRSSNHPVEDLYAMAGCDYIIGPLSTYSIWASFYGKVPLCHLHSATQPVASLNDFIVFKDQETVRWETSLAS